MKSILLRLSTLPSGVRAFVGGAAVSFGGIFLLGVVNYLIRRTLSLELPPEEFGFFYAMFALAALLTMLFQFGVKQAETILIANFAAKNQTRRIDHLVSFILLLAAAAGLLLCLLLLPAENWLLDRFFKYPAGRTAFRIFLIYILVLPVWGVVLSIPHGMKDFSLYYRLFILQMGVILAGCCYSAGRWGLDGVVTAWTAGTAGTLAVALLLVRRKYRIAVHWRFATNRQMIRKVWRLCSFMALSLTGIMVVGHLDTICLTSLGTLDDVANYNIALPIVQIIQSLLVLPFVFMPVASGLWQQKRYAEIRRIFLAANLSMLLAALPAAFAMQMLGDRLITLLFDAKFLAAKPALVILSAGSLLLGIAQFNLNLMNASDGQKPAAFMVLVTLAANLLLNITLIPVLGIIGAAIATAGSYLILAAAGFIACFRRLSGLERTER